MKRTKNARQKDGLTAAPPAGVTSLPKKAQAGTTSLPVMKDGEETPAMLLALLNSPLETMLNSQQARILGTSLTPKGMATIVIFYGTLPAANGLKEAK